MYGNYPNFQPIKVTKSGVEEFISCALRVPVHSLSFDRLAERPRVWRHSCAPTGATLLVSNRFMYAMTTPVEFAVCPMCGKVLYYYEN